MGKDDSMTIEQDFETVREVIYCHIEDGDHGGPYIDAAEALSRIEDVQKLATEQVEWLQRTKKEIEAQRDALKAALGEIDAYIDSAADYMAQRGGSGASLLRRVQDIARQTLKKLEEK